MAAASLIASPTLVVVDRKAGERKGVTQIVYSADDYYGKPHVWERIAGEPWRRVELRPPRILSSISGNPERDGAFSRTLQPGQVYQVVMYHFEYIDPNVVDPNDPLLNREQRPDASVTAVAILKDPERRDLIRSEDQNVGGTWFRKVVTTVVPTVSILQVSKLAPFRDADDMFRFLSPQATVFDLISSTQHDGLAEPLLPGNKFFYLMRVVDGDGNWQFAGDTFRTKQRKVTIDFTVLHVINDGADNDTTAEFRISVYEGKNSVRGYVFGNVDEFEISDRPDKGKEETELIPLPPFCERFVLGPKDTTDENYEVGILTRGLVYRATGSNEEAMNFFGDVDSNVNNVPDKAQFPFPTGAGELVQNVPLVVRAKGRVTGVEFEYDVTALFTVEYF